ncbi:aldo/keto reductase [Roseburia hominis]
MDSIYDTYTLNNGMKIPCMGFGTYKTVQGNNVEILETAIQAGYRYFDTASFYGTEEYIGQAVKASGIPREKFFLASKLWKDEMGYEKTKKALEDTLKRLQTDYLDIYMIHWPRPTVECENWKEIDLETWRAMEELYAEGKVRGLGLSNFLPQHLENILQNCRIKPVVDQLELHPGYMQHHALQYLKEHDIYPQAWSPIGRQRVLEEKLLVELSEKYQVSPAQICLRYLVQNQIIPVPKSSSMERMKENMSVFGFSLEEEDMHLISSMPQAGWSGEHPDPILATKIQRSTRK